MRSEFGRRHGLFRVATLLGRRKKWVIACIIQDENPYKIRQIHGMFRSRWPAANWRHMTSRARRQQCRWCAIWYVSSKSSKAIKFLRLHKSRESGKAAQAIDGKYLREKQARVPGPSAEKIDAKIKKLREINERVNSRDVNAKIKCTTSRQFRSHAARCRKLMNDLCKFITLHCTTWRCFQAAHHIDTSLERAAQQIVCNFCKNHMINNALTIEMGLGRMARFHRCHCKQWTISLPPAGPSHSLACYVQRLRTTIHLISLRRNMFMFNAHVRCSHS